ncbi:hypothetical protein FACS1894211_01550 [Clostridia bacterium]|nr:hypothetical protein FACS1894211_01550 [Clostridia bacterium]
MLVVSGDNKQLRPTSVFLKRYAGGEPSPNEDLNTQAALEAESLLDLASSRLKPARLTYHYRSKYAELIDFSNYAFYEGRLLVAPNAARGRGAPPIERVKVAGRWIDRRNKPEAAAVVGLVKKLYKTGARPSVGIVTFNVEQQELIQDMLDAECRKDSAFKAAYFAELNRKEDGGDAGIFVKNLENVQGDERDVIVFSTAYARDGEGKITSQFGSLSAAGGENRLNVAVTRAKDKIYLVTSAEPEDFVSAEAAKNAGPRLFKKYLQYARAVSDGNGAEARLILESMLPAPLPAAPAAGAFEAELKAELERAGYAVDAGLGGASCRISLAIRDKARGKYVLGIECDYAARAASADTLERDVYRLNFLESRGWNVLRVWSRDWWLSRAGVIKAVEKAIKRITAEQKL